jgi:hypothetical protein
VYNVIRVIGSESLFEGLELVRRVKCVKGEGDGRGWII